MAVTNRFETPERKVEPSTLELGKEETKRSNVIGWIVGILLAVALIAIIWNLGGGNQGPVLPEDNEARPPAESPLIPPGP